MRTISSSNVLGTFPDRQNQRLAIEFLRNHRGVDVMLAAATHSLALKSDLKSLCTDELPPMFNSCEVLQYKNGKLTLSTSNSALASKLRQYLPRLKKRLSVENWEISLIQIKVQVQQKLARASGSGEIKLPSIAFLELSSLMRSLETSASNEHLRKAISQMLKSHELRKEGRF